MDIAIPTAVWSGTFRVLGVDLQCHVLDDGRRIIDKDSFDEFMQALEGGVPMKDDEGLMEFIRWQKGR